MSLNIGVIGAGSWGTAIAKHLADKGFAVTLWCHEEEVVVEIRERHANSLFLPGFDLPRTIYATADVEECVRRKDMVVQVVPSHFVRHVLAEASRHVDPATPIISASKGIENETLAPISQVLAETLPAHDPAKLVFLSGPSFAREVAAGLPAAVVAASRDEAAARAAQEVFSSHRLRVYTSTDVTGVELGGALKNVIAIAAGCAAGIGFGHNTIAALITRGLAEITRLAVQRGATALTLAGLAGLGDLVLTCTGDLSRNRRVGIELGSGRKIDEILGGMKMVAEGVRTALSAHELAVRAGVEMPIGEQVYRILYEGRPPHEAVVALMSREPRAELERPA